MILTVGWALVACVTPKTPAPTESATEQSESCFPGIPEVVAEVNGAPITCEDLMDYAGPQIVEARVEAANQLQNAIDSMILERLLEAESDAQGLAPEDLVKREVTSQVDPPTDAEVEAFYAENAAQMPGPIQDVRPQIEQYLLQEKQGPYFRRYVAELEKEAKVQRRTPMLRIPVEAGDSPRWGKAEAPVQIIEFSDFQCPACQSAAPVVDGLKARFAGRISVIFRHYPLPFHTEAARAAQASECANEQEKFWEYHDRLFAETKAWTDADFVAIAAGLELDRDAFSACLESGRHEKTISEDETAAQRAGVGGTPAFFVNGLPVFGVPPEDVFAELIERELAAAL